MDKVVDCGDWVMQYCFRRREIILKTRIVRDSHGQWYIYRILLD